MTEAMTAQTRLAVGKPIKHDSGHLHVSGEARYIDDLPEAAGTLHAAVGISPHAHARIRSMDLSAVINAAGVVAITSAADIPGSNQTAHKMPDDPVFAEDLAEYAGQAVFAVAATSVEAARKAVLLADIEYEVLPPVLDIREAVEKELFVLPPRRLSRGDADAAMQQSKHTLSGSFALGGQEHFYLEGQIAYALPQEDAQLLVHSSTQHPHHVQEAISLVLDRPLNDITVQCRRMGGGFGGKESQAAQFACIAALLSEQTGRPVKYRVDRDADIMISGKRHCYDICWQAGFDDEGLLSGVRLDFASRCGISSELSGPVNDRTMFHADNSYYLDNVDILSWRCKTNTQSNTAFRGFGGPQGMMGIEYIIDSVARHLGKDPLEIRRHNLYSSDMRNMTPYGMPVIGNILPQILDELITSSGYHKRRTAIAEFNAGSRWRKRGIAITPVKFGISFTATFLNQAGALLHVYTDGTVQINHGGTEMGQGLYTKVAQVVAEVLQIDLASIRCTATATDKVPNASATAASSGSDLNGMAARAAALTIRQRLLTFASEHFAIPEDKVELRNGYLYLDNQRSVSFKELANLAWLARISLSATGFYSTPEIHYDPETLSGRPFYYFSWGAAVSEVEIDVLTGENHIRRVDILHDVGDSLNPALDIGQIEGGFVQGAGWLTTEALWWNPQGVLKTHAPSTYKIPTSADVPARFNVALLQNHPNPEQTIYRSKAVGEPPLMLAMSVFFALRNAVASMAAPGIQVPLDAPATPESILRAITAVQATTQETVAE